MSGGVSQGLARRRVRPARLRHPLGIFMLLVLFILGVTTHDTAMAASRLAVAPYATTAMGMPAHHHTGTSAPGTAQGADCCVMGQCLLGLSSSPLLTFTSFERSSHDPRPPTIPASPMLDLPFRPPILQS